MNKTIQIDGMSCQHCVAAVTEALQKVAGVASAVVSLEAKQAVVELAAEVTDEALTEAIENIGFDVMGIR